MVFYNILRFSIMEELKLKLKITKLDNLPKLSWLTQIEEDNNEVNLICGDWIESNNNFFVEGAWDGHFNEATFNQSVVFMGSGGIIKDDYILFVTPCNTLEAIY